MIGRAFLPRIITIPSADTAFREHVERLRAGHRLSSPAQLEARLRRLFPLTVVRERALSGEPPSWYVYRDGGWQPSGAGPWWHSPGSPRIVISADGWVTDANATARSLLGIEEAEPGARHFTDFVAPGTLEDAVALLAIVDEGHDLTATVLLRPTSGDVVAIDIHARREGAAIVAELRLAQGIETTYAGPPVVQPEIECVPANDVAFLGYAQLALSRMPEPTPEGLALRLRRLYPHARVEASENRWIAVRDSAGSKGTEAGWWLDSSLPWVRYDAEALILEANQAARVMLGSTLVGHYWQEFVTAGTTEQVTTMLAILAKLGSAESRFRMPGADGSLVEFDSWTEVVGDTFTTVIRPRDRAAPPTAAGSPSSDGVAGSR